MSEGESERTADAGTASSLRMYVAILSDIQGQIRFADSKAGFVAAINAVMFGFFASTADGLVSGFSGIGFGDGLWRATLLVTVLYLSGTFVSVVLVVRAVVSRFGALTPRARAYFGHIAEAYGKDYARYLQDTKHLSDSEWADELGTQIVEVSHIAKKKHDFVKGATLSVLVSFALWVVALFLLLQLGASSEV